LSKERRKACFFYLKKGESSARGKRKPGEGKKHISFAYRKWEGGAGSFGQEKKGEKSLEAHKGKL